jgi:hypothetical protein
MAHCLVLPEKPGAWGRCCVVDVVVDVAAVLRLDKLEARKYGRGRPKARRIVVRGADNACQSLLLTG